MLDHLYWVNQVRLYCERKRGGEMVWRGERELRRTRQAHQVDAEIETAQGVIGVEVELTRKKLEVIQAIVEQRA